MRTPLKRFLRFACVALGAASFQGIQAAHADWANFATVSMTDAVTPNLTNGYLCYTDGRDVACNTSAGPVLVGTGGLINSGGMTVAGSVSASAVSATYVSGTVIQVNVSTMPCSTGLNGAIRYSATSNTLQVCIGTTWSSLSSNTAPGNLNGAGSATAVAFWGGASSLTYDSGLYWDNGNKRLGVGTTNPAAALQVSGTFTVSSTGQASSPSLYVGGNGRVGINNNNPGAQFEISSTAFPDYGLKYMSSGPSNGSQELQLYSTGAPSVRLVDYRTDTTRRRGILGVNIATANTGNEPVYSRADTGKAYGWYVDASTYTSALNDPRVNAFRIGLVDAAGSSTMLAITPWNKAVGIGTFQPSQTLTVSGTALTTSWTGINFSSDSNVTPTAPLEVSGTVSATRFVGDGSGLSGITALGDRITSGTSSVIVNSNGNVSISIAGGNTGWFESTRGLIVTGVSATGPVSGTGVFSNGTVGVQDPANPGNGTHGVYAGGYDLVFYAESNGSLSGAVNKRLARISQVGGNGLFGMKNTMLMGWSSNADPQANPDTGLSRYSANKVAVGNAYQDFSGALIASSIGVGTANPSATLHVSGTFTVSATNSTGLMVTSTGKVGISNTNPIAKLDVWGSISASDAIQVGQSNFSCINSISGSIRFNITSNTLQVCTNAGWVSLASGTTGGSLSGTGSATAVAFWSGSSALSYDSGLYWDNSNKRLGIGTTAPSGTLTVHGASASSGIAFSVENSTPVSLLEVYNTDGTLGYNGRGANLNGSLMVKTDTSQSSAYYAMSNRSNGDYLLRVLGGTGTLYNEGLLYSTLPYSGGTGLALMVNGSGMFARAGGVDIVENSGGNINMVAGAVSVSAPFKVFNSANGQQLIQASGGAVGISTNSPVAKLDVNGTISASDAIQVGQSALACTSGIPGAIRYNTTSNTLQICPASGVWTSLSSSTTAGSGVTGGTANYGAIFSGATTLTTDTTLYIDTSNHRLGVGTSIPSTTLHTYVGTGTNSLRVQSGAGIVDLSHDGSNAFLTNYKSGGQILYTATGAGAYHAFWVSGTERVRIADSGNVGISNTNPIAKLDVWGSISASDAIQVGQSALACTSGIPGAIRYNATSNTIQVCVGNVWTSLAYGTVAGGGFTGGGSATAIAFWNGTNSLTYESATTSGLYWDHANGRLGVGTNAPSLTFLVKGANNTGLGVQDSSPTSRVYLSFANDLNVGGLVSTYGSSFAGVPALANNMAVAATNNLYLMSNGSQANGGSGTLSFMTGGFQTTTQTRMFIDSNGLVGIGTTAPAATLQVSGTTLVSASLTTPLILDGVGGSYINFRSGGVSKGYIGYNAASGGLGFLDAGGTVLTMVMSPSNSLGIGTLTPTSSLTVVGEVQVGASGAACVTSTNGGAIRYSAGTLYYCNGSNTWATLSGGGAGFTGGGSATAVAFWNGPNSLTYESATTSGLYWDGTNKRLGVGTNTPNWALTVSGSMIMNTWSGTDSAIYLRAQGAGNGVPVIQAANATNAVVKDLALEPYGGNVGIGTVTPTANLQVSGSMIVSTTGQNSLSSASLVVDTRGVSVSSIVHITGSPFSLIGAGGNVIISGTTAVSTSSAGSITFFTGGAQRMVVDTNGNVGIGKSNPSVALDVAGVARVIDPVSGSYIRSYMDGNGAYWQFNRGGNVNQNAYFAQYQGALYIKNLDSGNTYFTNTTSDQVRMTIDTNGIVMVGRTSAYNDGTVGTPALQTTATAGSRSGFAIVTAGTASTGMAAFVNGNGTVGQITTNGTATSYVTSSDRRLKENIVDTREGLQKLMAIGVVDFNFRKDPSKTTVQGFIAQDLDKLYPEAVVRGDEGKDVKKVWAVDYGRVTPLIVKGVQDLKSETDARYQELKADNDNLRREVDELRGEVHALTRIRVK